MKTKSIMVRAGSLDNTSGRVVLFCFFFVLGGGWERGEMHHARVGLRLGLPVGLIDHLWTRLHPIIMGNRWLVPIWGRDLSAV